MQNQKHDPNSTVKVYWLTALYYPNVSKYAQCYRVNTRMEVMTIVLRAVLWCTIFEVLSTFIIIFLDLAINVYICEYCQTLLFAIGKCRTLLWWLATNNLWVTYLCIRILYIVASTMSNLQTHREGNLDPRKASLTNEISPVWLDVAECRLVVRSRTLLHITLPAGF